VSTLDARIDDLYAAPLDAFVARRNELAKTLKGADAARVKRLAKPSVVPWAVNQVYWHARSVFDRVRKTGEQLRRAQLAALKSGRAQDVRAATDAHRKALGDAVAAASRLAIEAGAHPSADGLMRTFEALSLAAELDESPGRLTRPLQPAGFEALAGVSLPAHRRHAEETSARAPATVGAPRDSRAHERAEAARKREEDARQRRRAQAIAKAEGDLERIARAERHARDAWERSKRDLEAAEKTVARLREG
jgi:hypothetical protein